VTDRLPRPDAVAERALQAFRQGRFAEAAEGFDAARRALSEAGDEPAAAEAANNLCVALLQAGRPDDALRAVTGTPEAFDRLGDPARAAQALGNLASALEACGDLAGAERAYAETLQRFEGLDDREAQATILRSMSQLQLKRGRPLEALSSLQAGLEQKPRRGLRDRWVQRLLALPSRLLGR
jgi:tetratricopeptide (TPR) repeat protein